MTYTLIASTTLATATASVTFSSITQSYRDLVLVVSGTATTLATLALRFNADSGSNYSFVYAYGNGSTTSSASGTSTQIVQNYLATTQTNNIIQINDYSATDKHKTVLSRWNTPASALQMNAERWANTAGISTIECRMLSGTMNIGTTLNLYGIEA